MLPQTPILGDTTVPSVLPEAVLPEQDQQVAPATEIGGRDGPEPTRFGDWEKNGRCIDF